MKVTLKNVRLSFPDLFEPKGFDNNPDKRYGANFLIVPGSENHKAIEAAIVAQAKEKFDKKADAMLASFRGNANKICYLDGNLKEYNGYEGHMYLSARRKESDGRPVVSDRNGSPLTPADGKPYSGCYVNAIVDIYAQTGQYPGIRCTLAGVQFSKDGESFGGAVRLSEDAFEDLTTSEDDVNDMV